MVRAGGTQIAVSAAMVENVLRLKSEAMAGLYEIWRDPTKSEDDPDRFRWTCTILTTNAQDDLGRIHCLVAGIMPFKVARDAVGHDLREGERRIDHAGPQAGELLAARQAFRFVEVERLDVGNQRCLQFGDVAHAGRTFLALGADRLRR